MRSPRRRARHRTGHDVTLGDNPAVSVGESPRPTLAPPDTWSCAASAPARHPVGELDAKLIEVRAADGKVTLKGHVRSWAERADAERAAWAAPGVKEVDHRLVVASATF